MNFDRIIDRCGTHSAKWDMMEATFGVKPAGGIAMWGAEMDVQPPACRSGEAAYGARVAGLGAAICGCSRSGRQPCFGHVQ